MKPTRLRSGVGRAALALAACFPAFGQSSTPSTGGGFSLFGNLAGGGGVSRGGDFTLSGGPVTSSLGASSGGVFRLAGGLIGVYVVETPGAPRIRVEFTPDRQARLSWPADATGFQLEFASQLGPAAVWQPVSPAPAGNAWVTPVDQPGRFFRLRQP